VLNYGGHRNGAGRKAIRERVRKHRTTVNRAAGRGSVGRTHDMPPRPSSPQKISCRQKFKLVLETPLKAGTDATSHSKDRGRNHNRPTEATVEKGKKGEKEAFEPWVHLTSKPASPDKTEAPGIKKRSDKTKGKNARTLALSFGARLLEWGKANCYNCPCRG